jgi:hypothetical protein
MSWNNSLAKIRDFLTPQPVRIEVSLATQLSDALARSLHDADFRTQLLAHPRYTLAHLGITLPPQQSVTVLTSSAQQTFFVLPLPTESEIEYLKAGVDSHHLRRSIRSRIILKTLQDPDYKARLCADPKTVLISEGFDIPELTTVNILENDAKHLYLVIPTLH